VPEAPGLPWEPDFDDPVFLAKLDRFLAAAAARYDGDPNVAFVDVGSFGIWGEGQTFWSTKRNYSAATALRHIELTRKHFRKLVEASWPEAVRPGEPWTFAGHWRNAGVAPCLPRGHVAVTLKDDRGAIAAVLVGPGLDVRSLPVGAPGEAKAVAREPFFRLPAPLKPGAYDLFVSVGSAIGTPAIALPHDGDDGQRRVRLGQVRVLPPGAQR